MARQLKTPQPTTINVSELQPQNPQNISSTYVNNISFSISAWDLRMLCSEIRPTRDGRAELILKADLVMSHSHGEALLVALESTIKQLRELKAKSESAKAQ